MTFFTSVEEFSKAAERLCTASGQRCRFVTKYSYKEAKYITKCTDDIICLQFSTDMQQDLRRLEKLQFSLMRLMVSKEGTK